MNLNNSTTFFFFVGLFEEASVHPNCDWLVHNIFSNMVVLDCG